MQLEEHFDRQGSMAVAGLLDAKSPPIREDVSGVLRIGDTRVSMDSLVAAYNEGASAEEIVCRFPSLTLRLAHAAISFYLEHQPTVDSYLREREEKGDRIQAKLEKRFPTAETRTRILARRAKRLAD